MAHTWTLGGEKMNYEKGLFLARSPKDKNRFSLVRVRSLKNGIIKAVDLTGKKSSRFEIPLDEFKKLMLYQVEDSGHFRDLQGPAEKTAK
jgi:hypothetical protein